MRRIKMVLFPIIGLFICWRLSQQQQWILLIIVIKIIPMIKYVKFISLVHSTTKQEDKPTWALCQYIYDRNGIKEIRSK